MTTSLDDVSVIVPAFNAESFICDALDSILLQAPGEAQIIVVDDGSTDQTGRFVRSYAPRVFYLWQENKGVCAARNLGVRRSSGRFLCFLDADDIMVPGRIRCLLDFLERHTGVGMVFCDYRNFTAEGEYSQSHFRTCPRLLAHLAGGLPELVLDDPCHILAEENFGIASSFMIRRPLWEKVAGFNESLSFAEDFHFYFRVARHTHVGVINEVGLLRRIHSQNMTKNHAAMWSGGIQTRTMLLEDETNPLVRIRLKQYIARCWAALARFHANQGNVRKSLAYEWQALHSLFSLRSFVRACRSVARTLAIAIGIHRPRE